MMMFKIPGCKYLKGISFKASCLLFWVSGFFSFEVAEAQVVINEIMPANFDQVWDKNTTTLPGWIELYNSSSKTVDLTHYYLSDNPDHINKWQIPYGTRIGGHDHLLIWCDGAPGYLHANFSLSKKSEYLILSNPTGFIIDELYYPEQKNNIAYGRKSDGSQDWSFFIAPTPGEKNAGLTATVSADKPQFAISPGVYNTSLSLTFTGAVSGSVRYTTDGTEPTKYSRTYVGALSLDSTTTIKAKTFRDVYLPSETATGTFVISDTKHNLPVLSISMDPSHLWDPQSGIYVEGLNGIPGNCSDARNWNREWNRHSVIEYFDSLGVRQIEQDVDVRIGGACSRNFPQKSLVMRARSKYGSNLFDYNFFPNRSNKTCGGFILRNSGNDFNLTQFRDAFAQHLSGKFMDIDYLDYRPVVVYLNGAYWGIQNIREKADTDYLKDNYGYDAEEVDLLEIAGVKASVSGSWYEFDGYVNRLAQLNRTRPDTYQFIDETIDVDAYISYMVAEIYLGNTDWPGNNVRLWRPRKTGGKWRWVLWDMDFSFGLYETFSNAFHPGLTFATQSDYEYWPNPASSTLHFRLALENPTFRMKFINRMQTAMETVFHPDSVNHLIDQFAARIASEIPVHKKRWGGTPEDWQYEVTRMKSFATNRYGFMKQHMIDFFGLTAETMPLNITVSNPQTGSFKLNDVKIPNAEFSGRLSQGSEITVKPSAVSGYRFLKWRISESAFNESTIISKGSTWKYFDQGSLPALNWYSPNYSDAQWAEGNAELGYGDGDEATVLSYGPAADNKFITSYFRKIFTITDTSGLVTVKGQVKYDDGIIIYLNGAEVFRGNMPQGPVDQNTLALVAEPEGVFVSFSLPVSYLKNGLNILAAEIHQISGLSSDISFDLELTGAKLGLLQMTEQKMAVLNLILNGKTEIELEYEPDYRNISDLVINEVGVGFNTDDQQYTGDWIELYNAGKDSVDLNGLFLTDDFSEPGKHRLIFNSSEKLPPGEFKLLLADAHPRAGADHLNFKISEGEQVGIFHFDGTVWNLLDGYDLEAIMENTSRARIPDGAGSFLLTGLATPLAANKIQEVASTGFAYPNPFKDLLFIDYPEGIKSAKITDLMGRDQRIDITALQPYSVSDLAPGVYLLQLFTDSGRQIMRLVKR